MSDSVLTVIGGGRWGKVILSVLTNIHVPFDRIVIISKMNAETVAQIIDKINITSQIPYEILPTIDDLFTKYHSVKAAIIANAAKQHFTTANELINRGVHVLIEKPIVTSISEMRILIEKASRYQIILLPGLTYRFCSYLKKFAQIVADYGMPNNFTLDWSDAKNEFRYGQIKQHDTSISIIQDVMPHIWTILFTLFPKQKIDIHACSQNDNHAIINLAIQCAKGQILLKRDEIKRIRHLSLSYDSDNLALDFSVEPGVIIINSTKMSADTDWQQRSSPLAQQLKYFFSGIASGKCTKEDLKYAFESVRFTEETNDFPYNLNRYRAKEGNSKIGN